MIHNYVGFILNGSNVVKGFDKYREEDYFVDVILF